MTSTSNLADVVRHYQRSIERHGEDETRLLHCITKLFNLPITFEHLQETGIGKTVNALRKINGEVGVAAKTLVTKWKAMVAAEEEPVVHVSSMEDDSNKSNGRRSSEEDPDQENKGSNSSGGEDTRRRHKSKHDERRSKVSEEHKSKSGSSSSNSKSHSRSRTDSDKRHKSSSSSSHDKTKDKDKDKVRDSDRQHKESKSQSKSKESTSTTRPSSNSNHNHKSSSENVNSSSGSSSSKQRHHNSQKNDHSSHKSNDHSSHKSNEHSSHKSNDHSSHKSEHSSSSRSRHDKSHEDKTQHSEHKASKEKSDKHKSSSSSSKSSKRARSPQRQDEDASKAKISKTKSKTDAETADGFDSSMGANFDDVLGMLNMPMSGKKLSNKVKSPNKPAVMSTAGTAVPKRTTTTTTSSYNNGRNTSTKKPELLASTAKLEPLDPSIALELPTISNNYKPMPLNKAVMDVVFNHGLGTSTNKSSRNYNESEALAAGISSKTMRTKIYSGVRTGQILQVPSLFDLCTRVLQKNIDALEYTGGVPFEVLRPVLERATPHQLLNFEEYNPYLMEDSDCLWQMHVTRHCRAQRREEMETWREMFLRVEDENARKLSVLAESIKASQKISEAPVRKTQLAFVDSMVKPPRSVQRKQEQYGTKAKLIATPAARVAALSSVTPNAAKVGDARLRVLNAARDSAQVVASPGRNKKAPLMAKALQLIRGRNRR